MLDALSKNLSQSDIECGWNNEIRLIWLKFFVNLHKNLLENKKVSDFKQYTTIGRGLDSFGIIRGDLLEKAINISLQIRELEKYEGETN
jgi:hypothetical protein